jgi:DNA modification methylase
MPDAGAMSRLDMRSQMTIVFRPLDKLIPYARNARTHSEVQVAQIAGSMREFGWTNPILIDEVDGIIAGHGRVLAADKLGIRQDVPCIVLAGLSEAQKRALVIADNKLAMNAGWDLELLTMELGDIQSDGFDLSLVGFSAGELDSLLNGPSLGPNPTGEDGDAVPAASSEAISVPGDLWILGRHRLMCGDSTNPQHVDRVMDGQVAKFCFTSPPYGNQRDYKSSIEDWDNLMKGVFGILPVSPDAQVLVNLGLIHRDVEWVPYWDNWIQFMRDAGWRRFGWYVWDQGCGLQGDFRGRLAPSFEFIFHFNREIVKPRRTVPKKPENIRDKSLEKAVPKDSAAANRTFDTLNYSPKSSANTHKIPDSVIRVNRHRGGLGESGSHPAVFPVDLVSEIMCTYSATDDHVFEPFSGSGTQIISAQKNGRSCSAIDIAPAYVDVGVRRWQKFAAQLAVHEETGKTFEQIAEERGRTSR